MARIDRKVSFLPLVLSAGFADALHMNDDSLHDFERRLARLDRVERALYVGGDGPAVIVTAEIPGIRPDVARFAQWARDAGFAVYMPSLFGRDGDFPEARDGLDLLKRASVRTEFRALAAGEPSQVTERMRGPARAAHAETWWSGPGRSRHVLRRELRAEHDARSRNARAGPPPTFVSTPGSRCARHRAERARPGPAATSARGPHRPRLPIRGRPILDSGALPGLRRSKIASRPPSFSEPSAPRFFAEVIGTPHSVVTAYLIERAGAPTIAARAAVLLHAGALSMNLGIVIHGGGDGLSLGLAENASVACTSTCWLVPRLPDSATPTVQHAAVRQHGACPDRHRPAEHRGLTKWNRT